MPWKLGKYVEGNGWQIIKVDTGGVVGYSDSREKAMASIRARYAHMPSGEIAHKRIKEKHVDNG